MPCLAAPAPCGADSQCQGGGRGRGHRDNSVSHQPRDAAHEQLFLCNWVSWMSDRQASAVCCCVYGAADADGWQRLRSTVTASASACAGWTARWR